MRNIILHSAKNWLKSMVAAFSWCSCELVPCLFTRSLIKRKFQSPSHHFKFCCRCVDEYKMLVHKDSSGNIVGFSGVPFDVKVGSYSI